MSDFMTVKPPSSPANHTGTCALCKHTRELKKSHIIPNWYFKSMKNDEGKLVSFQLEPEARVRLTQDSWYERLLCEECEGRLNVMETRWIGRMRSVNDKLANGETNVELQDYDFDSFRTFLLSILWRASVSSLDPFKAVQLSDSDDEELRVALLAGSTRSVAKWHILIRNAIDSVAGLELEQLLLQPTGTAVGATVRYRFIFGGFVIDFFNQKMTTPESLVCDTATFKICQIAMTSVEEIMYAGAWAIDKDKRGLTDKRIGRKPKA